MSPFESRHSKAHARALAPKELWAMRQSETQIEFEAPVRIESEMNRRERSAHAIHVVLNTMNNEQLKFVERWIVYEGADASKCWIFTGCTSPDGYGRLKWNGAHKLAHRLAYELFTGPVPDGLQLDHLCKRRECANPAHLEPVSPRENVLRSDNPLVVKRRARQSSGKCARGHDTARWSDKRSRCLDCESERFAELRKTDDYKKYHRNYMREWKRNRRSLG